jgi:hypothetical protein
MGRPLISLATIGNGQEAMDKVAPELIETGARRLDVKWGMYNPVIDRMDKTISPNPACPQAAHSLWFAPKFLPPPA